MTACTSLPRGIPVTVANVLAAGAMIRLDCRRKDGTSAEMALPPGSGAPERGAAVQLRLLVARFYPNGG